MLEDSTSGVVSLALWVREEGRPGLVSRHDCWTRAHLGSLEDVHIPQCVKV